MRAWFHKVVACLRELVGADAYERYLQHHHAQHPDHAPLDRQQFYLAEQQRKWSGIKRCC